MEVHVEYANYFGMGTVVLDDMYYEFCRKETNKQESNHKMVIKATPSMFKKKPVVRSENIFEESKEAPQLGRNVPGWEAKPTLTLHLNEHTARRIEKSKYR